MRYCSKTTRFRSWESEYQPAPLPVTEQVPRLFVTVPADLMQYQRRPECLHSMLLRNWCQGSKRPAKAVSD
jgi:hypothetical protein